MKNTIKIPLSRPYFDKEEIDEVSAVLNSGWVAGQGPASNIFADQIASFTNAAHCIPVNNCTAGLHLALLALGIGKGDEVIVSDYTYPATGHSVLYTGAKPIFCDVNLDTFNMNHKELPKLITKKTKAIIVVHTFGNPANINEISKFAKTHNLKLVEDCACSLGSTFRGKHTGTFGDIASISFHARKGITTGEGGAIITNNKKYFEMMKSYSCFGVQSAFDRSQENAISVPVFQNLGFNYKMSDINAAIGIAQLKKIEILSNKRNKLASLYRLGLKGLPIKPQIIEKNSFSVIQAFVCLVDNRDMLANFLMTKGIQTQIGTFSSCVQPVYNSNQECANSIKIFKDAIALPMYHEMSEQELDYVVACIREYFKNEKFK